MANALNGTVSDRTPDIINNVSGEIKLVDSMIQIGTDAPTVDTVDSGWYSKYYSGGTKYTGLSRAAGYGSKDYWLFAGSSLDPSTDGTYSLTSNLAALHTGALSCSSATIGSLSGVLKSSAGSVSGSATTTDLTEGSNLYFTTTRAVNALSGTAPSFSNITDTGLTAKSALYVNSSQQLTSLALTNGQLMIGSTGNIPSASTLTGTSNQITVSSGAGSITLATPQDIGTASSVQFGGVNVGTSSVANIINSLAGNLTATANNDVCANYMNPSLSVTTNTYWMFANKLVPNFVGPASYSGSTFGLYCAPTYSGSATTNSNYSGYFVNPASGTKRVALYADSICCGIPASSTTYTSGLLSASTINAASIVDTGLAAKAALYADANQQIAALTLTNGQLMVGNTGNPPSAASITGTTDQITVNNGAGTITLSTPQSINTTSSPTFANLTDTALTARGLVYADATQKLASVALTNGQLLIGNSSNLPTAATLTSVANQTNISSGAGQIIIGTAQNIDTGANVQFGGINIGSAAVANINSQLSCNLTATANNDVVALNMSPALGLTTNSYYMFAQKLTPSFVFPASASGNSFGLYCAPTYSGSATTGSNYSAYFANPASGTKRAAVYADSLNVGTIANTTYTSGTVQCVDVINSGHHYDADYSTSTQFYKSETIATTWTLDGSGHTITANVRWTRCGAQVTVAISEFTLSFNGGNGYPYCTIPAAYVPNRPTAMACVISDNGVNAKAAILYVNGNPNMYIRGITGAAAFTGTGFGIAPIDPVICITGTYSIS